MSVQFRVWLIRYPPSASHRRPRVVCWSWTMDSLDWPPTMHFLSISHFLQWKIQTKDWQTFSYTCAFSPFHPCKYLTRLRIIRICHLSNLHYLSPSLVSVSPFNNNRSYSLNSLKGATWYEYQISIYFKLKTLKYYV